MVSESARRFEVRDDGEVVGRPGLHDPCVDRPERAIEQNVIELLGELPDALPLIAPGRLAGMVEGQGVLESDAIEVTDGRPVRSFVEVAGDEGGHRGRALTHEEADLEIMIRTASQVGLTGIAVLARGHAQVRVQDLERAVRRIDQVMPSGVPPVRSRRPSPRTSLTTTSTQLKSADGVYQERSQQREKYGLSFLYDSIGNITKKTQTNDMQVPNGTGGWHGMQRHPTTGRWCRGQQRRFSLPGLDQLRQRRQWRQRHQMMKTWFFGLPGFILVTAISDHQMGCLPDRYACSSYSSHPCPDLATEADCVATKGCWRRWSSAVSRSNTPMPSAWRVYSCTACRPT